MAQPSQQFYHTWKWFSSFHIRTIFKFMSNIIESLKVEACLLPLKALNWQLSCILLRAIWMLKWADSRCLLPEILICFFWHLACLLRWASFWGTAPITSSKVFYFFFSSVDSYVLSSSFCVLINCNCIVNHLLSISAKPHSPREKMQ